MKEHKLLEEITLTCKKLNCPDWIVLAVYRQADVIKMQQKHKKTTQIITLIVE